MNRFNWTLAQYVELSVFQQLDKIKFIEALKSAIASLHSLRLTHNDINPHNIMIKNEMSILIDFGSCRLYEKQLLSHDTPGWTEEIFYTSEKYDTYALTKLRQWIQNPEWKSNGEKIQRDDVVWSAEYKPVSWGELMLGGREK